jgi:3-phosphoshikimate 1-carboxyvinyltransferase
MALPQILEVVPPDQPAGAVVTVPGSKSITNRALILAALGTGESTLRGALWSEDTQVLVECLQELGYLINVDQDPAEPCNRTITVYGKDGVVPAGGTSQQPVELFVANAGTAARFLAAFVCLGRGTYCLDGVPRMRERPQAALFNALRQLGYRVDSPNDKLPATIHGAGPKEGKCAVSIEESSQFASALLLCAHRGGWDVVIEGQSEEESPYVTMTLKLLEAFPRSGGDFKIEPDASSGSYFWAAGQALLTGGSQTGSPHKLSTARPAFRFSMSVADWPNSGWQIDERFPLMFCELQDGARRSISRRTDLGDSIMTLITSAPLLAHPVEFTDLGRLRLQECERVVALRTELTKCGAKVDEAGDTLMVHPSRLHGATIETYNDHRMAMCFAALGLRMRGICVKDPACVRKTFPNFFQKMSRPAPHGPGAVLRDAATGRVLKMEELLAD